MAQAPQCARRSQVFIGIAAEEYGLLGSEYYAGNPVFPPAATVANINLDGLNTIGPTRDLTIVGDGKSDLDELVRQVAGRRGMTVEGDAFPEQGYFYRSDQFNFAKVGVPAVYLDNGLDVIGKPAGWGKQKHDEYVARDYHQPSDEIQPDWDWRGAEQMAEILFEIGWKVANQDAVPQWNPDAEFRAIREKSLHKQAR
jgi:Zn-dependent M28 family amino/carboxypeptidase